MRVLVTAASRHGATREIADAIAQTLEDNALGATVAAPEEVTDLDGFDAVILGSAVYAGHWLDPAKELVARLGDQLSGRPVWLFSSGPIGDPPKPEEDPVDVAALVESTGARGHRVFPGRLDRASLGWGEKAIVVALRAPEGDFRDDDDIRGWAKEIAGVLTTGEGTASFELRPC